MTRVIPYSRDLDIRNIESLPRGLNLPYLRVIEGMESGVWIAQSWHRKMPKLTVNCEAVITFEKGKAK